MLSSPPPAVLLAALLAALAPVHAGEQLPVQPLAEVVVTPTLAPADPLTVPAAVSVRRLDAAARGDALGEALRGIPGVVARPRQNRARDEQISIRGFGARSSFGVRGVRLYSDGIPATMPDGQGQVSHFMLAGAERIEVLRGPFSALHGNAAGGVIELFSARGSGAPHARLGAGAGRHGLRRAHAGSRGSAGALDYNVGVAALEAAGYRRHSRARRRHANARLDLALDGGGELRLVANAFDQPLAEDPQGLTRAEWRADPRQAAPGALAFAARKRVAQNQAGLVWEQPLGARQALRLLGYAGTRRMRQYLAVPVAAQASPLSGGGVVGLETGYGGADLRWTWDGALAGAPLQLIGGMAANRERQHRRGWENFVGARLGVAGRLRRDQSDIAADAAGYAQARWQPAARWTLQLGARASRVRLRSRDRYVTAANPDDSGSASWRAKNPVAGVVFAPAAGWRLHAAWGRGFETPTLAEAAYRSDGGAGLNLALRPARSRHLEAGLKWRGAATRADLALFTARTQAEIVVHASSGGRTSYVNAGRSRRRGVELELQRELGSAWRLDAALTWLDARFRDGFGACAAAAGCRVAPGARIPGVARRAGEVALRWRGPAGWEAGATLSGSGRVPVADAGGDAAPGHALLDLHLRRELRRGAWRIAPLLRLDNAAGRRHVGAVIVNQASGASFEPGPGRSLWFGVEIDAGD